MVWWRPILPSKLLWILALTQWHGNWIKHKAPVVLARLLQPFISEQMHSTAQSMRMNVIMDLFWTNKLHSHKWAASKVPTVVHKEKMFRRDQGFQTWKEDSFYPLLGHRKIVLMSCCYKLRPSCPWQWDQLLCVYCASLQVSPRESLRVDAQQLVFALCVCVTTKINYQLATTRVLASSSRELATG